MNDINEIIKKYKNVSLCLLKISENMDILKNRTFNYFFIYIMPFLK